MTFHVDGIGRQLAADGQRETSPDTHGEGCPDMGFLPSHRSEESHERVRNPSAPRRTTYPGDGVSTRLMDRGPFPPYINRKK